MEQSIVVRNEHLIPILVQTVSPLVLLSQPFRQQSGQGKGGVICGRSINAYGIQHRCFAHPIAPRQQGHAAQLGD